MRRVTIVPPNTCPGDTKNRAKSIADGCRAWNCGAMSQPQPYRRSRCARPGAFTAPSIYRT